MNYDDLLSLVSSRITDASFGVDGEGRAMFFTNLPASAVQQKLRGKVKVTCERDVQVTLCYTDISVG